MASASQLGGGAPMTASARKGAAGLTMVEILVALGVLAIALGSVLAVFVGGSRTSLLARERMEASRLALAVFDVVDKGWIGGAEWYGRDGDGNLPPADTLIDNNIYLSTNPNLPVNSADWWPAYVIRSPVKLVWRCWIRTMPSDVGGMHHVTVTVYVDETENRGIDASDRIVGSFYALMSDRTVTP